MKKISIVAIATIMVVGSLFTSCEAVKNTNQTQRGAAIGAVGGAVLGGILGNNLGKGGKGAMGAVLGGVVGGVAGGVIGNKMDKQARQIDAALPGAEVVRVGEGIKLVLNENAVRFDTNITIYGYTDSTGPADYNLKLSGERAASVRNYLASKGVSSSRFQVTGLGIADPIASNETVDGRSQNRRVEFAITANEKMIKDAEAEVKN